MSLGIDPSFKEAVSVMGMISRTPKERLLYKARLKFLRDEEAPKMTA